MDEDFKKEWVAALRSGDYPQTTGTLTRLDDDGNVTGHCCLGVACEIAVKKGILKASTREVTLGGSIIRGYAPEPGGSFQFSTLPVALLKKIGLRDCHGITGIPVRPEADGGLRAVASLPTINDSGESFEHIADLIEYFG